MAEQHILHPIVQLFARSIVDSEQGLVVAEEAFGTTQRQLQTVAVPARQDLRVDLIALAIKAQKLAAERAAPLITQIFFLVACLLGNESAARQSLESGGVNLRPAALALGSVDSSSPVATSSVAEGKSLFALRVGLHKK